MGGSGGPAAPGAVACQISRTTTWTPNPATGIASRTQTKPPKRPPTQTPDVHADEYGDEDEQWVDPDGAAHDDRVEEVVLEERVEQGRRRAVTITAVNEWSGQRAPSGCRPAHRRSSEGSRRRATHRPKRRGYGTPRAVRVTKTRMPTIKEVRTSPTTNPEIDLLTFVPISEYLRAPSGTSYRGRPRIFGASRRSRMTNAKMAANDPRTRLRPCRGESRLAQFRAKQTISVSSCSPRTGCGIANEMTDPALPVLRLVDVSGQIVGRSA